jgi:ABC-type branched-subunit amino acid transport system permease subunit
MANEPNWFENLTRTFFSWFSKKEAKTPLSYFFRIVGALTVVAVVALYLSEPSLRFRVFLVAMAMFFVMALGVYVFAWINPKHLVHGETGYRAETRFALGTEKKEIGSAEMARLEGTTNPAPMAAGSGERS